MDIIDADVLPGPEDTALVVQLPGGDVRVTLRETDVAALVAGQLYIGFYNLSGEEPMPEDFEGLQNKSEEERRELGLPPDRRRMRRLGTGLGEPFTVATRVAIAPLHEKESLRRGGRIAPRAFSCRATVDRTGWITHFAIGTHDRVLVGGELVRPLPMLPGNGLKFGLTMERMVAGLLPPKVVDGVVEE